MRASLFAVLGVLTALISVLVAPFIPVELSDKIGADAVGNILNILASSMLAVTTFSLSVVVASLSAATQNVTPRATLLLMQDNTSQTVLSTFVGSFLFSLVGLIALGMGAYGGSGRVVLFVVTLGVVVLIVVAILRWVGHLTHFGRVGDTTRRVEAAAQKALTYWVDHPCLGGVPFKCADERPKQALAILPNKIGYVEHVDMAALQSAAKKFGAEVYLNSVPGHFLDLQRPIAFVDYKKNDAGDDFETCVRSAVAIAHERSFDQDPRFGLAVLAEVASRALSASVNDIGTAIDVIGRAVRLLSNWAEDCADREKTDIEFPNVHVPELKVDEIFEDVFGPIARDGADRIEVQIRLQKALLALSKLSGAFERAAKYHSAVAYERAIVHCSVASDKERLRQLVD